MEAKNIIKAINDIKEDCKYSEPDESVQKVVTYIDTDKFYQRVMGLINLMETLKEDEQ